MALFGFGRWVVAAWALDGCEWFAGSVWGARMMAAALAAACLLGWWLEG